MKIKAGPPKPQKIVQIQNASFALVDEFENYQKILDSEIAKRIQEDYKNDTTEHLMTEEDE